VRSIRQMAIIGALLAAVVLGGCGDSTSTTVTNTGAATTTLPTSSPATAPIPAGVTATTTSAPATTVASAPTTAGVAATTAPGAAPSTAAPGAAPSTAAVPPAVTASIPDDTTPTAGSDADAFCRFELNVQGATTTADSDADFLALLKTFEPSMDQWVADAPTVRLRAAATKVHAATEQALATNSADLFNGDALDDAFVPISGFCVTATATAAGG
jgi:hypothetical protein